MGGNKVQCGQTKLEERIGDAGKERPLYIMCGRRWRLILVALDVHLEVERRRRSVDEPHDGCPREEDLAVRRRLVRLADADAVEEGAARYRLWRPRVGLDRAVKGVDEAARQLGEDGFLECPLVVAAEGDDGALALLLLEQVEQAAGALLLVSLAEGIQVLAFGGNWSQQVESLVSYMDIYITFSVRFESGAVQLFLQHILKIASPVGSDLHCSQHLVGAKNIVSNCRTYAFR